MRIFCGDGFFEGLCKFLDLCLLLHLDGVDARFPLRLGACLWCQADPAAYKRVVCVTVCPVTGEGKKHVIEACAPDDDRVKLVSVFRAWMTPGHPVLWLRLEKKGVFSHTSLGKSKTLVRAVRCR